MKNLIQTFFGVVAVLMDELLSLKSHFTFSPTEHYYALLDNADLPLKPVKLPTYFFKSSE